MDVEDSGTCDVIPVVLPSLSSTSHCVVFSLMLICSCVVFKPNACVTSYR